MRRSTKSPNRSAEGRTAGDGEEDGHGEVRPGLDRREMSPAHATHLRKPLLCEALPAALRRIVRPRALSGRLGGGTADRIGSSAGIEKAYPKGTRKRLG